ncbi:hypothetical protein VA7868_00383 [Vibrio aerogenes CECT 7868]|uniref:Uncharacterized protein n=1 Tax=Vibrio aerogenes CECT 7868 TaxID=1216006 RepID=A0A1M5VGQ5_9VIBR|nr:hypothetical protein [Vibrio aerogenes]SHH74338.1 hypothetical protein VA7868_00383 [Vibrio aerogenes CECT 7868]
MVTVKIRCRENDRYIRCDSDHQWCYANASRSDALRFEKIEIAHDLVILKVAGEQTFLNYRPATGAVKIFREEAVWKLNRHGGGSYSLRSLPTEEYMGIWNDGVNELYVRDMMMPECRTCQFILEPVC